MLNTGNVIMPQLLPHQIKGIHRIEQDKSLLLADEPGTGKSAIFIHVASKFDKVLILTLAGLKRQMVKEILFWLPNARITLIEGNKLTRESQWQTDSQFYVANYELILRDLPLMMRDYDYLICDECVRLSNIRNKTYRLIKKLKVRHKILSTGSPIQNNPTDLFGLLDFLKPGSVGSYWHFYNSFVVRNNQGWIVGSKNLKDLAKLVAPHMLRRLRSEVLDLPDMIVNDVPVVLGQKERQLYEQIKKGLLMQIEELLLNKVKDIPLLDMPIVKFGKLRELCDSMELLGQGQESAKLEVLKDLLLSLAGSKILIFTAFSRMASIIEREIGSLKIIGATSQNEREKIIEQFNTTDGAILAGTRAIFAGLNLQAGHVIINYDPSLSLSEDQQKVARVHRFGQSNNVLVYNLIVEKSLEKKIAYKLKAKADMSRLVLGTDLGLMKEVLIDDNSLF